MDNKINLVNIKYTGAIIAIAYIIQHPPKFTEFVGYLIVAVILYTMNEEFMKKQNGQR